jgi:hypothetical protein
MGVSGDDGDEERAGLDLLMDRLVPGIPAPKLALVEPDLNARGSQRVANAPSSLGILRGVAQEDSPGLRADAVWRIHPHAGPLEIVRAG